MPLSAIEMIGTGETSDCNSFCGSVNMSLNTGEASERMSLKTWKSTLSLERRIMSQSGLSKGAVAVDISSTSDMTSDESAVARCYGVDRQYDYLSTPMQITRGDLRSILKSRSIIAR